MCKGKLLLIGLVMLMLAGCQNKEVATPTPFPPTPEDYGLVSGSSITPVPAVLTDVMANPEFYEGAYLQVTGQYFRRPLQVCGIDPHPSPAGWELVTDDIRLSAGGFNTQLRQLMPDGITMSVIGRLTHWRGPVGCGKQAVPTDMWYLDVVKIIDPAQLALVTLTPSSPSSDTPADGNIPDELFTPVAEPGTEDAPPEETIDFPTSPPVAPPTNTVSPATVVVPIETLGADFTPVATDEIDTGKPTATVIATQTAVTSGTATRTPTPGTITSTPTATPGISTVTNTPPPGASATPVIISTTQSPQTTNKGKSFANDNYIEMTDIARLEIHEWTIALEADEEVTLALIGEPTMDMGITIYDMDRDELLSRDGNGVGLAESLTFESPGLGDYIIRISEKSGLAGGYLFVLGTDEDYQIKMQGLLPTAGSGGQLLDIDELQYWFFKGTQSESIDIAITCDPDIEVGGLLFAPDGIDIEDIASEEPLEGLLLSQTGWYALEIENWDSDGNNCSYELTVTK